MFRPNLNTSMDLSPINNFKKPESKGHNRYLSHGKNLLANSTALNSEIPFTSQLLSEQERYLMRLKTSIEKQ